MDIELFNMLLDLLKTPFLTFNPSENLFQLLIIVFFIIAPIHWLFQWLK